jgi:hypothetical protein
MQKIKTIRSHVGVARWLAGERGGAAVSEEPVGYLARAQVADIPSPYSYSPSVPIWQWGHRPVVWFETSHKHYEVFLVPSAMPRYATDEDATAAHLDQVKKGNN